MGKPRFKLKTLKNRYYNELQLTTERKDNVASCLNDKWFYYARLGGYDDDPCGNALL